MVTFLSLLAGMIEQRHKEEQQKLLLHRLVQRKNKAELEAVLKDASKEVLERVDAEGRTALIVAVQDKQPELVQLLLAHGADPNHADRARNTPLLLAAEHEDLKIAEFLLKGSDLTASNAAGSTLIHALIRNQRNPKGALKLLKMLHQGLPLSEFERKDGLGCAPLFLACMQMQPSMDVIHLLLKAKVAVDPPNADGRTPLLMVRYNNLYLFIEVKTFFVFGLFMTLFRQQRWVMRGW